MRLPQKAARRDGSIGSNTAKSRPTRIENTPWLIKADNKTCTVEGGQLREVGSSQGGHSGCGQQVNRIPDAAVRNDPIHTGNNRHRNPANNTALDARRIGMNLRRNTNTVACDPGLELSHCARSRCDWAGALLQRAHAHQLVLFHRQHVAKPPHRAAHSQNQTDHTDHGLCDQPRREQVMPKAVTKGQAVGAGKLTWSGTCSCFCSAAITFLRSRFPLLHPPPRRAVGGKRWRLTTDDVNHGKNNDPYAIDKMPVPREHLDVLSVRPRHVSAQAQDQDQHEQDQTHDHMTGMQADQRNRRSSRKD